MDGRFTNDLDLIKGRYLWQIERDHQVVKKRLDPVQLKFQDEVAAQAERQVKESVLQGSLQHLDQVLIQETI